MIQIIIKIIPVIVIFIIGYFLKKIKFFSKENGDFLLKIVFHIALPSLIILSITSIKLTGELIYLPISAMLIILVIFFISFFTGKIFRLQRQSFGVFLIGSLIMNMGFLFPFYIAAYGEEGLARASMFDLGNGLLTFTFTYFLACKYGDNTNTNTNIIKKFIISPAIWALIIAVFINLTNIQIPLVFNNFLELLGNLTIPLIMLALGIYFEPSIVKMIPSFSAVFIRMFIGLLLGYLFVALFKIDGLNRLVVLIGSSAPVGFNTLTFASIENLDKEFAASIVSISIIFGIFFIPLLILILN